MPECSILASYQIFPLISASRISAVNAPIKIHFHVIGTHHKYKLMTKICKSLPYMYILNSKGPISDTCGTPFVISVTLN